MTRRYVGFYAHPHNSLSSRTQYKLSAFGGWWWVKIGERQEEQVMRKDANKKTTRFVHNSTLPAISSTWSTFSDCYCSSSITDDFLHHASSILNSSTFKNNSAVHLTKNCACPHLSIIPKYSSLTVQCSLFSSINQFNPKIQWSISSHNMNWAERYVFVLASPSDRF